MASLGDLSVLIGAEVNEAGFTRAVNAIGGIETAAQKAAAAAGKAGGSLGNLSDVAGKAGASINTGLVASFASFDKTIKPIEASIGRLSRGIQDIGGGLTTYVTVPLAGLATAAILAAAKVDSLMRGLQAVTEQQLSAQGVTGLELISQSAAETQRRLKELREVAKLPGLGFAEAVQGSIRLQAVGLSADRAKAVLLAFGNAIATTGGGKSELDRVTVQLGQLSAKGKVLAQDLRPIIEAAPAAAQALRRLYGTVDSESISKSLEAQGKSASDFIDTLTAELAKLPKVSGGLAIAGENLSDSFTLAGSTVGLLADKLFDLSGLANTIGNAIESLAESFSRLDPSTQKLIFGLGAAAAAAGPLLFVIGSIGVAVPAVTAGFATLGITSLAALGPIALAAAGVGAALYLVYENAEAIGAYFGSGEGGVVLQETRVAFDDLGDAVTRFAGLLSGLDSKGVPLPNVVLGTRLAAQGFQLLGDQVSSKLGLVSGILNGISGILSRDLSTTLRGATQVAEGLIPPLATIGRLLRKDVQQGFEGAAGGGGVFGDELLHVSGLLTGFNSKLQGFAGGLPQYGKAGEQYAGILEELRAKLEALQKQRETETTVSAIRLDTTAIDAVQKQIDDLVGKSGKGSDAITKAFESLQKALRAAEGESIALGAAFDYIGARRAALEGGIKSLIAAGLSPTSAAIKALVKDLQSLPQAVDQLVARAAKGTQVITPDFELKLPDLQNVPGTLPLNLSGMSVDAEGIGEAYDKAVKAQEAGSQKLTDAQANSLDRQRAFNTQFEELVDNLSNSIGPLIADFAGQFGEALGSIVTGSATASDALAILFGGIVAALGEFMTTFGKQLVTIGIGKLALDSLFTGPQGGPLAIAAGLGLIALGSVVSAVGKSAAASLASIGSGGGAGASLASQPKSTAASATTANQQPLKIIAEFKLRGTDLVAVGRLTDYRSLRTN